MRSDSLNAREALERKIGECFGEFLTLSKEEQRELIHKLCNYSRQMPVSRQILSNLELDKYEIVNSMSIIGKDEEIVVNFDTKRFPFIVFDSATFDMNGKEQLRLFIGEEVVLKSANPLGHYESEVLLAVTFAGSKDVSISDVELLLLLWSDILGVKLQKDKIAYEQSEMSAWGVA